MEPVPMRCHLVGPINYLGTDMNFTIGRYQFLGHDPFRAHDSLRDMPPAKSAEPSEGDSPAGNKDVKLGFFKMRRVETPREKAIRTQQAVQIQHAEWDSWSKAASAGEDRVEAVKRMKECDGRILDLSKMGLTGLPSKLPSATLLDISENKLANLPKGLAGYDALIVMNNPLSKGWWSNMPAGLEDLVISEGQLKGRRSKFPGVRIRFGKSLDDGMGYEHPLSWGKEDVSSVGPEEDIVSVGPEEDVDTGECTHL